MKEEYLKKIEDLYSTKTYEYKDDGDKSYELISINCDNDLFKSFGNEYGHKFINLFDMAENH